MSHWLSVSRVNPQMDPEAEAWAVHVMLFAAPMTRPRSRQRRCASRRVSSVSPLSSPASPLLSSLDAACVFPSTEGSSAWIIRLRCYWCIKLRVWFLSRPCHQSQFARALAECNISLIGSTRKLRRWTILIREEIIKLGAPGKISPSEHYCKRHQK